MSNEINRWPSDFILDHHPSLKAMVETFFSQSAQDLVLYEEIILQTKEIMEQRIIPDVWPTPEILRTNPGIEELINLFFQNDGQDMELYFRIQVLTEEAMGQDREN